MILFISLHLYFHSRAKLRVYNVLQYSWRKLISPIVSMKGCWSKPNWCVCLFWAFASQLLGIVLISLSFFHFSHTLIVTQTQRSTTWMMCGCILCVQRIPNVRLCDYIFVSGNVLYSIVLYKESLTYRQPHAWTYIDELTRLIGIL